jgi:hypothetical protein
LRENFAEFIEGFHPKAVTKISQRIGARGMKEKREWEESGVIK